MSALKTQVNGSHYKDMVIQPITFCQKNKLGYAESLAIKYICRHGNKNGQEDIEKAIHCLQLLIELEYGEQEKENPVEDGRNEQDWQKEFVEELNETFGPFPDLCGKGWRVYR